MIFPLRASFLVLLFAQLCCGGGRTVMVDGQPVPYEQAQAQAFERARGALGAGKNDEAAALFARFLSDFPDAELGDEARLRRGQALLRSGKLPEAEAVLTDLLEKHPTSRFKNAAALELAKVQARQGRKADASAALKPLLEGMSEQERKEAAGSLAEVYADSGNRGEAARLGARAVEAAEPADRDAKLAEFAQRLAQTPADEVARLVAELDRKSPAWPLAALRLCKLQLHLGDRLHAQELAGQIALEVPSGAVAEEARALQLQISSTSQVKPNLLGVVLPQTGDLKAYADAALDAIALRIDPLGKGAVQISVKDSRNDPDGAARAVEELAREGAIAIIGPLGPVEGPAAAARAQMLGVPLIAIARTEGLTQLGSYVFRNMLTNSAQAKAVADYAQKKLGARSFGVLQPDSPYGDELTRHFWDAVDQGGGEVRAYERYPRQTTTFKPFIAKMVGRANLAERAEYLEEERKIVAEITDPYRKRKALSQLKSNAAPIIEFDALFIPDNARMVRLIAPAVAAEDVITSGCDEKDVAIIKKTTKRDDLRTVQLLGTSLWDSPDLIDERMGAARYVQCSVFADGFFAQSQRPATRKFVEEYEQAYHRTPSFVEAHAQDAAGLLRELIEKKHPQTREELRDQLANLEKPYDGATGSFRFGPDREAQKQLFWLWVNRGTFAEFDPEGPPPVPPAQVQAPVAPTPGGPARPVPPKG